MLSTAVYCIAVYCFLLLSTAVYCYLLYCSLPSAVYCTDSCVLPAPN